MVALVGLTTAKMMDTTLINKNKTDMTQNNQQMR